MKKIIVLLALFAFVVGAAGFAITNVEAKGHKVALCHYTSSDKNEMEIIMVAESAVDAHLAHGDDYWDSNLEECVPDPPPPIP